MLKKMLAFVFILSYLLNNTAQAQLKSPAEFLGYKTGTKFTPHYKIVNYLQYLSSASGNIKLHQYGRTYEDRPLFLAFIGSQENIKNLESIRQNNLTLSGMKAGKAKPGQPVIIWLSYSVHGNEASSSEAALETIYHLLNPLNDDAQLWLKNAVVIIDPCMNPDGRERYVNFYNSVKNITPDAHPFTREHKEPWPGGRTNHYYADLNRDWAWQSQIETQQRMEVYNKWLPQVHIDFHEQGINEPYYFAPAAEPLHQDITKWQRDFQVVIGKNNARYFDKNGWLYFTKERFDLLYPSYGDTYPIYNGAIGMTYEQGGSGRAGLAVVNHEGNLLTLQDRILHHHTSALATIEITSTHASQVIAEYSNYFNNSQSKPSGDYKSYIIRDSNPEKLRVLSALLKRNGIQYGFGVSKKVRAFNYFTGKNEGVEVHPADLVISSYQPKSVLLKVLFEPATYISDSITYDVTAWAIPYAHGLQSYATKSILKPLPNYAAASAPILKPAKSIAYASNWNSLADVKFLAALLKNNINVRYSEVAFNLVGKPMNPGSLIITRTGNERLTGDFDKVVTDIARKEGVSLQSIQSGLADKGPDLGSSKIRYMQKPKIAVLSGEGTSATSFGEVWHFFEQQVHFSASIINASDLDEVNLYEFNVIILPDGSYRELPVEKLSAWINEGGKLIAMQNAISSLAGKRGFSIRLKEDKNLQDDQALKSITPYAQREREAVKSNIPGAIYKVDLDNTHPLAFGYPKFYYTIKLDDKIYQLLNGGWNVGVLKDDAYVSGFAGAKTREKLVNGLLFGVQEIGKGSVVYLAENPLFRGFWENGKLLFSNAIFMVGE
ncbi:M14 metallopeptidase family protein [Desertivirga xinjiangensis]|uniref:M14 metallopeptidase family protein n=1 Tax=Desertivirga xinjiangensis TaxID=539206 RepID=UPI00210A2DB8|nr:M14 metallopeptidase family protein [Pedobacter xinjiangensis]